MSLSPNQITIAITVYNRRQYIKQAIASAVNQNCRVQVMVVEDCGPDPDLEKFVKAEFGGAIQYIRNPLRRGLFGNWNACLELCRTEWISILHDDDYLAPCFIQAIIDLSNKGPGCSLYFGTVAVVDAHGNIEARPETRAVKGDWMHRDLNDVLYAPFFFPGHVFPVEAARHLGGFRESSFLAGDWEMWAKLIAAGGSAQTAQIVAFCRDHGGAEKGTNQVIRQGRLQAASLVQHKRVLALFPIPRRFDRRALLRTSPFSSRFLLRYACFLTPRLLHYNIGLFLLSKPPHFGYRLFQICARLGGSFFVRTASRFWNRTNAQPEQGEFQSLR
jgi:glycosyltransferase involved in cell wall biosynthesis